MVDKFPVNEYFAYAFVERAMIAHNTNEMNGLDGHLYCAQQPECRLDVNTVDQS